jgi:hypothetical protein
MKVLYQTLKMLGLMFVNLNKKDLTKIQSDIFKNRARLRLMSSYKKVPA